MISPVPEADTDKEVEVIPSPQDSFLSTFNTRMETTEEDDTNTIVSVTTTRAGVNEDAEVEPASIWYKFHVNMDTNQTKALEKEFQKKNRHEELLDAFSKV